MSRKVEPLKVVIHRPSDKASLDQQVARAHALQVERYVRGLDIPGERKKQLVNSILYSGR